MNWRLVVLSFTVAIVGPPLAVQFAQVAAPYYSTPSRAAPATASDLPVVEQTLLLHFWRPNCPVSVKTQARVRMLQQHGLPIRSYNTLTHREKSREYRIDATPTFILIEGGDIKSRYAGGLSTREIQRLLNRE